MFSPADDRRPVGAVGLCIQAAGTSAIGTLSARCQADNGVPPKRGDPSGCPEGQPSRSTDAARPETATAGPAGKDEVAQASGDLNSGNAGTRIGAPATAGAPRTVARA